MEQRADAVSEMQEQEKLSHNIESRYNRVFETDHDHRKDVVVFLAVDERFKILAGKVYGLHLHCEMKNMIDDEA